jgi:hypothetical protein
MTWNTQVASHSHGVADSTFPAARPSPERRGERPPPARPGHGILGMRERAAMLGGTLTAGPTPDGGYLVEAVLPLDAQHQQRP